MYAKIHVIFKPIYMQFFIGFKGSFFKHIRTSTGVDRIRYTILDNSIEIWSTNNASLNEAKKEIASYMKEFINDINNDINHIKYLY